MHHQVFKPLYYWGEARDKLMQKPTKVLHQGLAGHAFMMHPYKLSGEPLSLPPHCAQGPDPRALTPLLPPATRTWCGGQSMGHLRCIIECSCTARRLPPGLESASLPGSSRVPQLLGPTSVCMA